MVQAFEDGGATHGGIGASEQAFQLRRTQFLPEQRPRCFLELGHGQFPRRTLTQADILEQKSFCGLATQFSQHGQDRHLAPIHPRQRVVRPLRILEMD